MGLNYYTVNCSKIKLMCKDCISVLSDNYGYSFSLANEQGEKEFGEISSHDRCSCCKKMLLALKYE